MKIYFFFEFVPFVFLSLVFVKIFANLSLPFVEIKKRNIKMEDSSDWSEHDSYDGSHATFGLCTKGEELVSGGFAQFNGVDFFSDSQNSFTREPETRDGGQEFHCGDPDQPSGISDDKYVKRECHSEELNQDIGKLCHHNGKFHEHLELTKHAGEIDVSYQNRELVRISEEHPDEGDGDDEENVKSHDRSEENCYPVKHIEEFVSENDDHEDSREGQVHVKYQEDESHESVDQVGGDYRGKHIEEEEVENREDDDHIQRDENQNVINPKYSHMKDQEEENTMDDKEINVSDEDWDSDKEEWEIVEEDVNLCSCPCFKKKEIVREEHGIPPVFRMPTVLVRTGRDRVSEAYRTYSLSYVSDLFFLS